MALTPKEMYELIPRRRPYPFDLERKQTVEKEMHKRGIKTLDEFSRSTKISKTVLCEVINGTRLSEKTEERIARFFGLSREELFPRRTRRDLALLNKAQRERELAVH